MNNVSPDIDKYYSITSSMSTTSTTSSGAHSTQHESATVDEVEPLQIYICADRAYVIYCT